MTKPREKNREELTAEIEDSKKKIRQYENREKMLRQKLSREERRERSHRLIVRGAVFESIVPEAKTMTDEEAAGLFAGRPHTGRVSCRCAKSAHSGKAFLLLRKNKRDRLPTRCGPHS